MTAAIREQLALYALGAVDAEDANRIDRAIAIDPELAAELASYRDAASWLIAPVAPSAAVKARLMASVGGGRLERFAHRIGELFGVEIDRARELLGLIDRPASWIAELPGIELVHFPGGPAYATADCGFIRLAPGTTFPHHTHRGDEACIVLVGRVRDTPDDLVFGAGAGYARRAGSAHALSCDGDAPCIFAVRAIDGIEVAGAPVRPRSRGA